MRRPPLPPVLVLVAGCATVAAQAEPPARSARPAPPVETAASPAPAAPTTAPAAGCPPDPEAQAQAALAPLPDPTRWPAEVRLRIRVRPDGAIDCVRVVGASHPDFVDDCQAQLEGRTRRPAHDDDGQPIEQWLTYLCEFEPKH